jgi:hypothetical protein
LWWCGAIAELRTHPAGDDVVRACSGFRSSVPRTQQNNAKFVGFTSASSRRGVWRRHAITYLVISGLHPDPPSVGSSVPYNPMVGVAPIQRSLDPRLHQVASVAPSHPILHGSDGPTHLAWAPPSPASRRSASPRSIPLHSMIRCASCSWG